MTVENFIGGIFSIFLKKAHAENRYEDEVAPLYENGLKLVKAGSFKEALIHFNKILKLSPNHAKARAIREKIIEKLEKMGEAPKEPDEEKAETLYCEGNALMELEMFEEAADSFEKALKFYDKSAVIWFACGNALSKLNRFADALECFERALDVNQNFADAWYGKGACLAKLNRLEESLECFDKIVEIDPEHSPDNRR